VRPGGDAAALAAAVALPLVGVALTLAAQTWLTVAFLMLVPAIVVVYGLGLLVLVRALRRRSLLRRELGHVPRRYRLYAWLWSIAFLVAAVSPTLGGLDLAWSLQAALVGLSAVVVGIVTGMLWSTYQHDVAWVTAPREH
jgi:MFS family permease